MGLGGDFNPQPIDIPDIEYAPSFENGITWATQYSSFTVGAGSLSQNFIGTFASNFITRDIGGKTLGICVNPWDFNFVKARKADGSLVARPDNYSRTSFQECDCSYHLCDRDFQGIQYSLDLYTLWTGEPGIFGLRNAIGTITTGAESILTARQRLREIGVPNSITLLTSSTSGDPPNWTFNGVVSEQEYEDYKDAIADLDDVIQGSKESALLTYALIKFAGSVTAGVALKNNIVSTLAFAQETLEITVQDYGDEFQYGEGEFAELSRDIINNYARKASIPGFTASEIYQVVPGVEDIRQRCMCVDGGMHGLDTMPFADNQIVIDQLTDVDGIGGLDKFEQYFDFDGIPKPTDLAAFLTIDGQYLKNLGVTGAKPYKYGPNWAYGVGYGSENVIAISVPEFKNWEARDSGKIRISGTPNGEPYSFGNQWLEWGQRIGVPPIEYVTVNPKSLGGGDFVDANFGYRGSLEGTLIYRGRLPESVLPYESQDYEFAFLGITYGDYGAGFRKFHIGLTTISQNDGLSNYDAYGETGSIEDIVFSENFSESPQDKTLYRL